MKLLKTMLIILISAATLNFSSAVSWAIPSAKALQQEIALGGDLWRYDYILHNTSDPIEDDGYNLYDFFLNFSPTVTLSNILSPLNWDSISDSSSFIDWFSQVPGIPPDGADIAPGTSLSGFSFTSNTQLASLSFNAYFTNPIGDPVLYTGSSAPVPEPNTIMLLASGLAGLGFLTRKRYLKSWISK